MTKLSRPAAVLILISMAPACGLFRKSKPVPPPAVITAPPPHPAPAAPEPLPSPPGLEANSGAALPKVVPPEITQPAKPAPAKRTSTRRPSAAPAQAAPTTEPAVPVVPPLPAPHLTQLLTPAEQQTYNKSIDEALQRTHQNLARVSGKKLTAEQTQNLQRIHNFVQQASQSRQADLVTARSLAQRADLLAQDLVKSLRN